MKQSIAKALVALIDVAQKENRYINGLLESIKILDERPEDVTLFITSEDVSLDAAIQRHLLEAYCVERDIPIIRVQSSKGELVSIITEGEECEKAILTLSFEFGNSKEKMGVVTQQCQFED